MFLSKQLRRRSAFVLAALLALGMACSSSSTPDTRIDSVERCNASGGTCEHGPGSCPIVIGTCEGLISCCRQGSTSEDGSVTEGGSPIDGTTMDASVPDGSGTEVDAGDAAND